MRSALLTVCGLSVVLVGCDDLMWAERSDRFTENTRGAYPLHFIGNADPTGMAGQPTNVVLLTADAFGVLPPISRLTADQAQYHFISGYTAKLAGTEVGVREPQATFSACFGAPFMPRHPAENEVARWGLSH